MSRALPSFNRRRVLIAGVLGGVMVSGVVVVGAAMAGQTSQTNARTKAAVPTVNCPAVKGALPAIPAQAQAEVDRNLALLDTQIAEANRRLVTTQGQGGPNFVNNAILGPLKDKRVSTIDRIAISIGRHAAKPTGLDSLAACTLNTTGVAATATPTAAATPSAVASATASATATGSTAAGTGSTIVCPDVAGLITNVPASAQAGVSKELALLQTQINEANTRLANTVGQGGPNFVNNAILGPLTDKRVAVIDRIVLDFTRTGAAAPNGVNSSLAACKLS
ncbi:MAG: hypothetical protein QOF84_41 [Streptomyces sp.]|nr:hypothetical protein [Streptomyces sp.]